MAKRYRVEREAAFDLEDGMYREGESSHFAYAFVDICIGGQGCHLFGRELQHAHLSLLAGNLGPDHIDLLLSCYCLTLNLLYELEILR